MFYIGTKANCDRIALEMDSYYSYPNENTKTANTSLVMKVPSRRKYCVFVPADFPINETDAQYIGAKPVEFNAVD